MGEIRGGRNNAGFVQVVQGRTADADRLREMLERSSGPMSEWRPDIIGGTVALHGDGGYTQAVYFTSEAAAREGEAKEPPPELRELAEESQDLLGEPVYYDLWEPWLASPRLATAGG
ncbi:MAG TPA: hypothetical protein VFR67_12635 [Pilimelia sp.]|nr:hypothetical protein [Pilimelia sp.]